MALQYPPSFLESFLPTNSNIKFSLIYAKDLNNLIGINVVDKSLNKEDFYMPWNIDNKEDLKYFKEKTDRCVCIMGYNTFQSIKFQPLKNRLNIVISRSHYQDLIDKFRFVDNLIVVQSLEEAIKLAIENIVANERTVNPWRDEIFFIGGASIFNALWYAVDYIYQTIIENYNPFVHNSSELELNEIYIQEIDSVFVVHDYFCLETDEIKYTWEKYCRMCLG